MDASKKNLPEVVPGRGKDPPHVTKGALTAEIILQFDHLCQHWFLLRKVPDNEQVMTAAPGLLDPSVSSWWFANRAALTALKWSDFLDKLRTRFLSPGWADDVRGQLFRSEQKDGQSIEHWMEDPFMNSSPGLIALVFVDIVCDK